MEWAARSIRRSIIDAGQEIEAADFGRHINDAEGEVEKSQTRL